MKVSARARGMLRREREKLEEEAEESGSELNSVPFLDIVTNILIFLLATITSVLAVGNIGVNLPQRSSGASASIVEDDPNKKPDLGLMVGITSNGFILIKQGKKVFQDDVPDKLPTIPKKGDGNYDYAGLSKILVKWKAEFPESKTAILIADSEIVYEFVIGTMDVLRKDGEKELFPVVLFSAGFQ